MDILNKKDVKFKYNELVFNNPRPFKPNVLYGAYIVNFRGYHNDGYNFFEFTVKVFDENGIHANYRKHYPARSCDSIISRLLYGLNAINDEGIINIKEIRKKKVQVMFKYGALGDFVLAAIFPWNENRKDDQEKILAECSKDGTLIEYQRYLKLIENQGIDYLDT